MPLDAGLSAGRNLLLSQVLTPFVMLLDDDLVWNDNTLPQLIEVMESHPELDLVAGEIGGNFAGLMHAQNELLYLMKGNRGMLIIFKNTYTHTQILIFIL